MEDSWTEIITDWKNGSAFIGHDANGAEIQIGSFEDKPGVGPMRLLLMALAGCTGLDIVSILEKKRIDISDIKIRVRGKRAGDYPKIWTDIHVTYLIWSENLLPEDAEQAIKLSKEKYCSVGIMLGKTSAITSEYQILKPSDERKVN